MRSQVESNESFNNHNFTVRSQILFQLTAKLTCGLQLELGQYHCFTFFIADN